MEVYICEIDGCLISKGAAYNLGMKCPNECEGKIILVEVDEEKVEKLVDKEVIQRVKEAQCALYADDK